MIHSRRISVALTDAAVKIDPRRDSPLYRGTITYDYILKGVQI